jgi:uncharacterized protein DUF5134
MTGPLWARWLFALLCVAAGAHCATRLGRSSRLARARLVCADRPADVVHLVMAGGMAVMFAPVRTPIPPSWWAVGFALLGGWLVLDTVRVASQGVRPWLAQVVGAQGVRRRLAQVVGSVVMVGMFAVLGPDGLSGAGESHAGHLAASSPVLAVLGWASVAFFVGQVLVCGARLAAPVGGSVVSSGGAAGRSGGAVVSSGGAGVRLDTDTSVRLLMALGMSYMLLTML